MTKPTGWRNLPKHFCVWLRDTDDNGLASTWAHDRITGNNQNTGWCGKPVTYIMHINDDGNRERKYFPFCQMHTLEVAQRKVNYID